ncbi:hypothetical protein [uncultured Draconibacterium sp.]|uniref:hypothetical protein n=1 Tax=uncultured Draconibacterium sp. TaxID=1573823 RepID=UPI0025D99CA7|nr:hypothetical protein [uncultured Draconibacterium sp.]
MQTKNEFFAEYFLARLEKLTEKIKKFSEQNKNAFGEYDVEKSTTEELVGRLNSSNISDDLTAISEEWDECVIGEAAEGFPVINTWEEYKKNNNN